jgi:hypothetical protein
MIAAEEEIPLLYSRILTQGNINTTSDAKRVLSTKWKLDQN